MASPVNQVLRTIVETMSEGAVTLDSTGRILYSNRPFADMVGLPPDAVTGSSIYDYLMVEDRPALERLTRAGPGEEVVQGYFELAASGGGAIPVYMSMKGIDISRANGVCLVVTDLSEQRRLHRKMAEELEWLVVERTKDVRLLSAVVENMPVGVDIWKLEDPEDPRSFRMVSSNHAAEVLTGAPRETVIGRLLSETHPRFYETGVPASYIEAMRAGEPTRIFELLYGDERLKKRYWSIMAVPLPEGHLATIFEDITQLKEAERDYRKFKELADSSSEAIAMRDKNLRLVYTNEAYDMLYGYERGEMIGKRARNLPLTEEDLLESNIEKGHWRGKLKVKRRNGARISVLVSSSLLKDDEGNVTGQVEMLRDISPMKRAEEQLRRANSNLIAYAHTVSHDLRSPLTSVILANESMRNELDSPEGSLRAEVEESTRAIARNVGKIYSLVNDLLTIAEYGQAPVKVTEVEVAEVVHRVLEEQAHEIEEKGVEVRVDEELGRIRANETQVYQVFLNLIINAIRHNDSEAPKVEVRNCGERNGVHEYLVRDNSSGIPEELMDVLYVPFKKEAGSSGKGIGLAIVKKIIDVYGGDIRAYNDNGACFEFSIPDLEPTD